MAEASSSAPEAGQAPVAPLCEAAASEKISIDCAICLDVVKEGGTIDSCIHIFCFKCILDWSKVTNKCPICNSNFKKITEQIDEEVSQLDAKDKKRKRKRKPKTVKVQSRQQHVSYDYTGTFAGYSDDDDDSDYFSDDSEGIIFFTCILFISIALYIMTHNVLTLCRYVWTCNGPHANGPLHLLVSRFRWRRGVRS